MAEEQTAGRGQQSARWWSEPGKNLTFSLLLHPRGLPPTDQFWLNKCVCVALNEALTRFTGESFSIKWPNDVYLGDQKVGGMLIENLLRGSFWNYAIIGIGLNVNQREFPEWLPKATSLSKILQGDYDLNRLLLEICRYIEVWYLKLKAGRKDEITSLYLSRLYRYQQVHQYALPGGETFEARLTNVTDTGLIELTTSHGPALYSIKEVEFREK